MLMFHFWSSDIKGSQKSVATCQPMTDCFQSQSQVLSVAPRASPTLLPSAKRRRSSIGSQESPLSSPVAKRLRVEQDVEAVGQRPSPPVPGPLSSRAAPNPVQSGRPATNPSMDRVREVVSNEMGHEILIKHNELRLIEQELAKCQCALEQLRRCHLIPYPVNCPTPDQVLNTMSGKGPALQTHSGASVPQWAPPFGVVDGPYARHYAKWLIPDPSFDGLQVDFHVEARQKGAEGRTTRNSYSESVGVQPKRPARGFVPHKLQALSSGYPVRSDKAGPCTLIRQLDGLRVKLVCLDCHRDNFSSTQGFINHCRISHKRDYKSHEEAARKCGQPIGPEPSDATIPLEETPAALLAPATPAPAAPVSGTPTPGFVHPFARPNLSEQETYVALKKRITQCIQLVHDGRHPFAKTIPTAAPSSPPTGFVASSQTPYLSKLLSGRNVARNLDEAVQDATMNVHLDDVMGDDSEDGGEVAALVAGRTSAVMRIPAAAEFAVAARPASSKGHPHLPFSAAHLVTSPSPATGGSEDAQMPDVDDLGDLSPNTMSSNNAPSLVSDDGEYEDSEMPSDSEAGDSITGNSVSDVAEINLEEDSEGRPIRRHRSSSGTGPETVRLRRDDIKHVAFVNPIKGNSKPVDNVGHLRKT